MNEKLEIEVKIDGVSVRVAGTEEFVDRKFSELSKKYLSPRPTTSTRRTKDEGEGSASSSINKYIEYGILIYNDADEVVINRPVPGKNMAEKTRAVAEIMAYASDKEVSLAAVREQCRGQGCYDGKNFALHLKKDLSLIVDQNKHTIRLTVPGKEKVRKTLEGMIDDGSKD